MRAPSRGARGMQPDDAECDRQALAALDDADQVGIREIVIGLGIAGIGVAPGDQTGERFGAHREIVGADRVGELHRVAREIRQMRTCRLPVGIRRIDARELQRRVTDVDLGVRQHADRFQGGTWVSSWPPVWG